ncbi:MAG: LuxR C-terminal-related transcriptional regulator [Bacteroidota bacterium]|nr:LuxR C-terminal-related transcriptional regulator [Bacteroidota bacterium]
MVVFEPSVLIQHGIKGIVDTIKPNTKIIFFEDCFSLNSLDIPHSTDIQSVMINTVLLSNCPRKWQQFTNSFPSANLIGIVSSFYNRKYCKRFSDCIFLSDDEPQIRKVLEKSLCKRQSGKTENYQLSERETEVLSLLAIGKSQKDVAEELFISFHTVVSHRRNIAKKLGINSVAAMAIYAVTNGLIDAPDGYNN